MRAVRAAHSGEGGAQGLCAACGPLLAADSHCNPPRQLPITHSFALGGLLPKCTTLNPSASRIRKMTVPSQKPIAAG